MGKNKKLVLIDGSSYLYRAFYALPPLTNQAGMPTGAIYGFVRMVSKLISQLQPQYIAVVFDLPGKTFRHDRYEEYKATRKETPDDLKVQIPYLKKVLELFGIKILEKEGFEADDIIATLSKKAREEGFEVIVVTPDKDMLQLIEEGISILNPVSEKLYDREAVKEKYGVYPEQFIDYLSMVGDSVDNIAGVKGVGPKTAAKLLEQYGSLEKILQNIDQLKPKLKEAFQEAEDRLERNRFLVKLKTDIPLDITPEDLKKRKADFVKLQEVFQQLGFKTLMKEIGKGKESEGQKGQQKSLFQ
ncbi:MAG: 5'-3' exonuclease [Aquificae bacterium]|nr:5'-3' exonuclease [Aquificota bacterium]